MGRKKIKEMLGLNKAGFSPESHSTWDSGLVLTPPKVLVPNAVMDVFRAIQKGVDENEFSVLVKGVWVEGGLRLTEDYYIPKQKVTSASIDYEEDIGEIREREGYNVFIHSHPFSHTSRFSYMDEETVNCHFECSLLYTPSGVADGRLAIKLSNGIVLSIKLSAEDIIEERNEILPEIEGLENIKEELSYVGWGNSRKYDWAKPLDPQDDFLYGTE